jgi:FkbM family methyltransferase
VIYDVGAYHGDFASLCRRLWAGAEIHCFEPLPHKQDRLKALAASLGHTTVHECALGSSTGIVTLNACETASSVLDEHHQKHPTVHVRQRTIDEFVNCGGPAPDLLKIDVQGYEHEVLMGAQNCLQGTTAILAELTMMDLHKGAQPLSRTVHWLFERGFTPYDLCGQVRRPLDGAMWTIDLLFVRTESPLRQDKRWTAI